MKYPAKTAPKIMPSSYWLTACESVVKRNTTLHPTGLVCVHTINTVRLRVRRAQSAGMLVEFVNTCYR